MEHSIEFKRELKKLNVEASMIVFADLMALGYKDIDAYKLSYPQNMTIPEYQQKTIMNKILSSMKFQKLLSDRKSRITDNTIPVNLEEVEIIGSDEVAKEILRSAKAAPVGSKERADLFIRYDDIRQRNMGLNINRNDNDNISFFFPLKCNMCPLFQKIQEKVKEEQGLSMRSEEMNSILHIIAEESYPKIKEAYDILHCKKKKQN